MIPNKRPREHSPDVIGAETFFEMDWFGLVWFLCLMAYQLFLGYLMPKPFS